ncbi:uncharacterized protein LOC110111414 isoform X1 [Dendrobium catenatum]|uniref:uncharacterized protein LOC110111414 isoform X1 n=1 Tax=Dendrobium catenatum TaxID=906689 RepID=UPI0009F5D6B2|nr:uncharacterized protein LOC110111414 isoform X1 [Dendrobium catenatum]
MASRLRLGHQEELGSGGKILHGRLHLQPFAPYNRPSTSAAPLALPAPELEGRTSPSWFRGLISGAGKLISSVLGSEGSGSSPSECSSDCSSSDEDSDSYSNEHDDHLLVDGLTVKKRESAVDGNMESLAIVSKSESKLLIEQLLMQETFTRAEYSKLLGILQSRVLDIPSAEGGEGTQNEVPKRVSDKRPWQPLNQNRNISTTPNFSPGNISIFSPRYYASEAVSPDLRNKAVMEAKKWFEEKRLSASPVCDPECGPCILNTDMNQHYSDGDDGSPIEMAKAYMQSLPPWRSPSFSTVGLKNPPSSGKLSCSVDTHLLRPSKVKKRNYVSISSRDSKENSKVSLKSVDNEQRSSKFRKAGSITRPSRASSATTNFGYRVEDEHLKLPDRKTVEVGHQMEMHKEISPGIIMDSREASKEAEGVPKDVDATYVTEAQIGSISAPQDSLVFVSTALENGDSFPETETLQPDNVVPAESSFSVQKSYSEVKFQAENAIEVKPDSDFKHAHACTESEPPDENPLIPKDAVRPAEKSHINGHFTEINNLNSDLKSTSNGGCEVAVETHKPPNNVTEPAEFGRGKRRVKKAVRQKRWKA